jgi:PAS domain S-box-containing protein
VNQQEPFLAAVVASSDDAIIGKDLDGRVLSWSPGAERLYGYSAEEMKGRSISVLFPKDRAEELPHIMRLIAGGERLGQYETERVTKDGRRLTVELNVSPVRDPDGQIIGAAAVARDITEQKKVQRELTGFARLPVAEPDPLHRYRRVAEETAALKARAQPRGAGALMSLSGLAPPVLHATFARSAFATRLFNITITNVPGPPGRLYALDAPMVDIVPMVPLAADHALGIAVVSYAGRMVFGLTADYDSVPDLDVMAEALEAELGELSALAARLPTADKGWSGVQ